MVESEVRRGLLISDSQRLLNVYPEFGVILEIRHETITEHRQLAAKFTRRIPAQMPQGRSFKNAFAPLVLACVPATHRAGLAPLPRSLMDPRY